MFSMSDQLIQSGIGSFDQSRAESEEQDYPFEEEQENYQLAFKDNLHIEVEAQQQQQENEYYEEEFAEGDDGSPKGEPHVSQFSEDGRFDESQGYGFEIPVDNNEDSFDESKFQVQPSDRNVS